uniref:EF-hand domain-containing protein n=3 Tax=Phasianinae TaxID=9072 RepID=A0A669PYI0_PHACC
MQRTRSEPPPPSRRRRLPPCRRSRPPPFPWRRGSGLRSTIESRAQPARAAPARSRGRNRRAPRGQRPRRFVLQQPRQVGSEAAHFRFRQQGPADGAQRFGLAELLEDGGRGHGQVSGQLAQRHVEGRALLGLEARPPGPQQQPQPRAGPGRAVWRGAPRHEDVVGQPQGQQAGGRRARVPGQRLQAGARRVEEQRRRRGLVQEAEPPRGAERLGRRRLHQQRVGQVEAVQMQVVDGGGGPQAVEAHAEAGLGAEQHGLQPYAQQLGGEDLRQAQRRLRQQQHVAALQGADVDRHQHVVRCCRVALSRRSPAQAQQHLPRADLREVELLRVERLRQAAHCLRPPALGAALRVELGQQAHGAGQHAGGQLRQVVPEQPPRHALLPGSQQRPVEAGQRGARPGDALQDELILVVREVLGLKGVLQLLSVLAGPRCHARCHREPDGGERGHELADPAPSAALRPDVHPITRSTRSAPARASRRSPTHRTTHLRSQRVPRGAGGGATCSAYPARGGTLLRERRSDVKGGSGAGRHGGFQQPAATGGAGGVPGADIPEQAGDPAANPFQHRICRVFSTSVDGDDSLSFEDFLDMLSAFSDAATSDIKSNYAFRIFDFDEDGVLDRKDLEKLVNCLTGQGEETRLSSTEMEQLIRNVLEESDIDKDGTINLSEFQHVISRSPDFVSSFKIVL